MYDRPRQYITPKGATCDHLARDRDSPKTPSEMIDNAWVMHFGPYDRPQLNHVKIENVSLNPAFREWSKHNRA